MARYALASLVLALVVSPAFAADETSSGDKLRMLYSNQFTFNDDGVPLVTIELLGGTKEVVLGSAGGTEVLPDGESGARIRSGAQWTVTVENAQPAKLREWTVVARIHPDHDTDIEIEMTRWKKRGFRPRTFEIGTVFGVDGDVMDTREMLVAVAATKVGAGKAKAAHIAEQFHVETSVHTEIVRLPRGTVVAKSGSTVIENPSVLWFKPVKPGATLTLKDVRVGGGGSQLGSRFEDRNYVGTLYVTIGKDGRLVVVNSIAADRLLAGLVPAEIYASAPRPALEAQAIAARTELLEKLGTRHFGDPFLLCSTQQCQVYAGAGKEDPRTTAAVNATRGLVLRHEDGRLVDARYSADCGGFNESKAFIWGGSDPALTASVDAPPKSEAHRRFAGGISNSNIEAFLSAPTSWFNGGGNRYAKGRFRWTKIIDADELSARVNQHYDVGRLMRIEPMIRGTSGRIKALRLVGEKGAAIAREDLHIRRLLGGLRSSLFVVKTVGNPSAPDQFAFRGGGFGHGVGMCQMGAIDMANQKHDSREILRHYYKGSSIKQIY